MITIGADPEVFISKDKSFVPAYGLIPGTKKEPFRVKNGAVQVDGVALEFNIDPATNSIDFQKNITEVFNTLKSMVPEYEIMNDCSVSIAGKKIADAALTLGCDPDFNVYTQEVNSPPENSSEIRCAGGHIHIGGIFDELMTDEEKFELSLRTVRLMDKMVGVYSLLWDDDDKRRKTYGQAGNCRLKPYGVEYRSLSNKWLFNTRITKFVFDNAKAAAEMAIRGYDVTTDFYKNIIDSSEKSNAFFERDVEAKWLKCLI